MKRAKPKALRMLSPRHATLLAQIDALGRPLDLPFRHQLAIRAGTGGVFTALVEAQIEIAKLRPRTFDFRFLPASAAEARAAGIDYYYTGAPCRHGHLAPRRTSSGRCVECTAPQKLLSIDSLEFRVEMARKLAERIEQSCKRLQQDWASITAELERLGQS